jgi:hypothetical protein
MILKPAIWHGQRSKQSGVARSSLGMSKLLAEIFDPRASKAVLSALPSAT